MVKVATVCLAIVALVGSAAAVSYPAQYCPSNEVLVASPPCCEPTCDCDCEQTTCQQLLVYQPTCVCMTGFVRLDGQCVPKSCCPAPEAVPSCGCGQNPCQCAQPAYHPAPVYQPEPVYQPCETTYKPVEPSTCAPPVYDKPSCGCGQYPCQCAEPAYHPAPVYHPEPVYQPCETTYKPVEPSTCAPPVYDKPSCGCGQYPCQCAQPAYHPAPVYHPEPVYQPCETTYKPVEPSTCAPPVYDKPSCGCGQYPCQCAQPAYHPAPVYHPEPVYQPCETTYKPVEPSTCAPPVYDKPSCGCGQYPCQCAQPDYHPSPAYPSPCETTTAAPVYETTAAPTCAPCEQLVFAHPCCEPTCDNDCSGVQCSPLLLVEEPTCACRPGLVRYQGHCVEPTVCPRSASRYRLFVPKTVSCACNTQNVVVY